MMGAMYFFLRGVPFIYQGQELGMVNFERTSMDQFNDLSSIDQYQRSLEEGLSEAEALRIVNLRSRDNARTPFPWNSEKYGGFTEGTPWLDMTEEYPQINAEEQKGKEGSIYEFYKEMIAFRQHGPYSRILIEGNIEPVNSGEDVIAYRRFTEEETIYCLFNFSGEVRTEILPKAGMIPIWGNLERTEMVGNTIKLQPYQAVLIKEK